MAYFFDNLKNNFDFFLRFPLSRKNYGEKAEDLTDIDFAESKEKYGSEISQNSTRRIFLENLYFLNVFDKYLTKNFKARLSVLDVGSKNWSYVKSEYFFFKSFAKNFVLNGIELDAYRMTADFYTRFEVAKFYKKGLENTNYIAGDFLKHSEKYDYIIWILPFITQYPLVRWGLPLRYFKPEEMLARAYDLLNENGELLIINQGEEEHKIQQELNKTLNLPYTSYGEIEDKFGLFKNKRYCLKIVKS